MSAPTTAERKLVDIEHDFDTQAGLEMDTYMEGAMTDDWFEGTRAFLGERAAKFGGC